MAEARRVGGLEAEIAAAEQKLNQMQAVSNSAAAQGLIQTLGFNPSDFTPEVMGRVKDLGVGKLEDFKYCTASDLTSIGFKPVFLRKLQAHVAPEAQPAPEAESAPEKALSSYAWLTTHAGLTESDDLVGLIAKLDALGDVDFTNPQYYICTYYV